MPVIVDHDSQRATVIGSLLGTQHHTVTNVDQLNRRLSRRPQEYAVVLGPDVPLGEATQIAETLRLTRPTLSVILLSDSVTTEVMRAASAAGIREVIEVGDADALVQSVARARQVFDAINGPSAASGVGKVITVFSPKGGVGKTTTTINLAHCLVDGGNQRVCIVDLDLAFGDVAITMQLIPQHTIAETAGVADVDYAMLENLLTEVNKSLYILAAPTNPDAKDRVSPALVRRVLVALRAKFDFVVVDTAPGFDEEVLQAFDETDECVLVANLDVPTIKNVKVALETMDLLDAAVGHRWLVLNRADDAVGLTAENVTSILNIPIAVQVPSSQDVAKATNHGVPIVVSSPDHPVSRAMRDLAQLLSPEEDPALLGGPDKARRRRGLFRRAS